MNRYALLIDFGATRIKSAILDLDEGSYEVNHISEGSSVIGQIIPTRFFTDALLEHIACSTQVAKIAAIVMCCEMHGFARPKGKTSSDREYISWRYSTDSQEDTIRNLNGSNYKEVSGLRPRRGLPAVTLLAETATIDDKYIKKKDISFLPDEICRQLGGSRNIAHVTLAHASGFFARNNNPISDFGLDKFTIPEASTDDLVELGYVTVEEKNIPCFGGYGDLQASMFGAAPERHDWIINLGTGSQLISAMTPQGQGFELRKYFQEKEIHCVTHIPAGRALNLLAKFFQEIRQEQSMDYFWDMLASAAPSSPPENAPIFDFAIFREALGYETGGEIRGIHEDALDVRHFFAGLLNSFLNQYLKLMLAEDHKRERQVVLAGNMAKKLPNVQRWFETHWCAPVRVAVGAGDPTLECMARLATNNLRQRL